MKRISIVGAGRAGRTLGRLLRRAGWRIDAVVTRRDRTAREAARFIGGGTPATRLSQPSPVVMLAVPDDAIEPVCRDLAARGLVGRGSILFHLCGNFSSRILDSARRRGAAVGSLHPLESFARPEFTARRFRGTVCAFEGDPRAERALRRMIRDMGGVPMRVRRAGKPRYHAAAVFAANYVVAVLDAGMALLESVGVPRGLATHALAALSEKTLDNVRSAGIPGALTGPIARGDVQTVAAHLKSLGGLGGALVSLYAALGRRTVAIAARKGTPRGPLGRILKILARK
jgi:predicted short-subunit dehydrogenase-like oxidoreductase (DUF2520 family)